MSEAFDPLRILAGLRAHGVTYVLVGGLGAAVREAQADADGVDICLPSGTENLARLALALQQLGAQLNAPASSDDEHQVTFETPFGRLSCQESDTEFALLQVGASDVNVGRGVMTRVASLDDLARSKRTSADLQGAVRLATYADAAASAVATVDATGGRAERIAILDDGPVDADPPPKGRLDRILRKLEGVDAMLIDLSDGQIPRRRKKG
jgi:hypothetical protein